MKTIDRLIDDYIHEGMSFDQASLYVCQQIILKAISRSPLSNSVLIKGGTVIYNLTHNLRRATSDLDFDFIRYDISNDSIYSFFNLLNKNEDSVIFKIRKLEELHHEDYKGKRVFITISDMNQSLKFKLDIGVHTLLEIEQETLCFSFSNEDNLFLRVNPPEQIFSEKLISLAKHEIFSTRYKDIFDMYYFINNDLLNKSKLRKCIDLLLDTNQKTLKDFEGVREKVQYTLTNKNYIEHLKTTHDKWIDDDIDIVIETIISFILSMN